jgi:enterochelin esterase-like enzyme
MKPNFDYPNATKKAAKFISLLFTSTLFLPEMQAQSANDTAAKDTPTNAPAQAASVRILSPEIHHDRTVTFRLLATNAPKVAVSGEWGTNAVPMIKDELGVWTATVGPLNPDIYDYSFSVGGVAWCDPNNMWAKPLRFPHSSLFEVPGQPPSLWEIQRVPHGAIHVQTYFSESRSAHRRLHVYTPPGYEKSSAKYPVLYLLHGKTDNDAAWTATGRANFIEDNLLARREAKPMIIVMPDGHPIEASASDTKAMITNRAAFCQELAEDIIPLIDSTYRTKPNRDNRAIIGLSMGGGQALTMGLAHREMFAWVGGMSSHLPDAGERVAAAYQEPKNQLKLLWFACGKDDGLLAHSGKLDAALTQKGVPHTFKETTGTHNWLVWRRYLGEFIPLLFGNASP